MPPGDSNSITSPSSLPINAFASGELIEILFEDILKGDTSKK